MSPRTPQQYENIREEKRSLIMDTALKLFAVEGYQSTSISKIASEARISKGLMYNYFASKDDLIRSIVEEGFDKIGLMIDPNKDGKVTKKEVAAFIETMFGKMNEEIEFWTFYMSILTQPNIKHLFQDKMKKTIGIYMQILIEYFASLGHEDPETDALLFGALLDGIGLYLVTNTADFPVEKVKNRLIQLFCS